MAKFHFTLVLSGVDDPDDELADALVDSGCSDALLAYRNCVTYLVFDRVADTFESAVRSAMSNVESAGLGVGVSHIEPSDLVTMAEIARRSNRSRQSVEQLVTGDRGGGGFPIPVSGVERSSLVWSWAEVAQWLLVNNRISDSSIVKQAMFLREINDSLEHSRLDTQLADIGVSGAGMNAAVVGTSYTSGIYAQAELRLRREFEYFRSHQDDLAASYRGRFLLIRGESVDAHFGTMCEAVRFARRNYEMGTFMIQYCDESPDVCKRTCAYVEAHPIWEFEDQCSG